MNITVHPDRELVRAAGGSERFASIHITAAVSASRADRDPIDVSFVRRPFRVDGWRQDRPRPSGDLPCGRPAR